MLFKKSSSKKYTKIPGSERAPMPNATKTGAPDPNELMHVTVVLRSRSGGKKQPSLDKLIAKDERLTREEYQARYGAEPADVAQVATFASQHGLTVAQVNTAARTIVRTGRTADFSQAFQVQFEQCEYKGRSFRQRTGAVNIPPICRELSSRCMASTIARRPRAFRLAQANPMRLPPRTRRCRLRRATASSGNGAGQAIAIIELGGGYTQADLQNYFTSLKLPMPTVIAVSVDGAQNDPTGDPNGPDTEVALDIEVAGAVAPGATIVVYFAPNSDAGFLDAINAAAMDNVHKPSVISISWGGPESSWTAQSLQTYNSALQAAATLGVTVCVACGDNGSAMASATASTTWTFPPPVRTRWPAEEPRCN